MNSMRNIRLAVSIFIVFTLAMFLPGMSIAGNLEPTGPPGPTMHTLDEIYGLILYCCKQQGLPKTGQTTCYDSVGTEIDCAGTGQDGEIQAGVAWPDPRFTNNGDGTVTDNFTRLMWTQNAQQISGTRDWSQALNECNGLSFANHTDWRLPNVRELQSLADYENSDPALPTGHYFLNARGRIFWSSTTHDDRPTFAWYGHMYDGGAYAGDKTYLYSVWCVRGGQ
jgi:hypothetical protein